ncbi:MAG: beta-propeller fold lactonase family protein [Blastocatellia bacterium]
MKRRGTYIITILLTICGVLISKSIYTPISEGHGLASQLSRQSSRSSQGKMVVNDLAAGNITVIDVSSDEVIGVFALPPSNRPSEPMYIQYSPSRNRVFVSDHGNSRVVVFNAGDFSVEATVEAGSGPFHMWADPQDKQLWVVNENDNTCTVLDPVSLKFLATVRLPADLVAKGGKPHDVVLEPTGNYAYVTFTRLTGEDYIIQYSMETFRESRRAAVINDHSGSFVHLHVCLTERNDLLYIPRQGSNVLTVLDRNTLEQITEIPVPGAHGARMGRKGKVFYTTNIQGGGPRGLFAIDTETNTIIGKPVDTPYSQPHNIALTGDGRKLYLTHSGDASNKVTVYSVSKKNPVPFLIGEVTVGLNPFGITYVP